MRITPSPPFQAYAVYKNFKKKDQRWYVTLVHIEMKTHRIMAFARYALAVKIGRELTVDEEADHADGNKQNDDPSNLQVLAGIVNRRKAIIEAGRTEIQWPVTCPECGTAFTRPTNYLRQRRKDRQTMFCSRRCSGAYNSKRYWAGVA